MPFDCPLCKNSNYKVFYKEKNAFKRLFYRCEECLLIFLDPRLHLPQSIEKSRYEHHNNEKRTEGYEKFLRTLINPLKKYIHPKMRGLDFGCGPYPMLIEIFKEDGFEVKGYDPYFEADEALMHATYDFVTSCEVVEHFNNPQKSFEQIDSVVRPGGYLALKTSLYNETIDFESWYYIKDDTHISLYSKETMEWISKNLNYEILDISESVVILRKLRADKTEKIS